MSGGLAGTNAIGAIGPLLSESFFANVGGLRMQSSGSPLTWLALVVCDMCFVVSPQKMGLSFDHAQTKRRLFYTAVTSIMNGCAYGHGSKHVFSGSKMLLVVGICGWTCGIEFAVDQGSC